MISAILSENFHNVISELNANEGVNGCCMHISQYIAYMEYEHETRQILTQQNVRV